MAYSSVSQGVSAQRGGGWPAPPKHPALVSGRPGASRSPQGLLLPAKDRCSCRATAQHTVWRAGKCQTLGEVPDTHASLSKNCSRYNSGYWWQCGTSSGLWTLLFVKKIISCSSSPALREGDGGPSSKVEAEKAKPARGGGGPDRDTGVPAGQCPQGGGGGAQLTYMDVLIERGCTQ